MQLYNSTMAAMAFTCTALALSVPAVALDVGGPNGVSVGGNGSGGVGVSVGGRNGVNSSVGGTPRGGLGVDASVGGANGVNSNTSVSGSPRGGLGAGTTASVGGSRGINANVNANVGGSSLAKTSNNASIGGARGLTADVDGEVGGSRLATARATVGTTGNTLADILLGVPSNDAGDVAPGSGSGIGAPGGSHTGGPANRNVYNNSRAVTVVNDMSAADRAKAKVRCRDVVRSGGYDASLTKLCKMVLSMD